MLPDLYHQPQETTLNQTTNPIQPIADSSTEFQNIMAAAVVPLNAGDPSLCDVDLLPPEVREELRGADDIALESQIIDCLEVLRVSDLDRLIIALYHRYRRVIKRTRLSTMLARLIDEGEVIRPRRGYYAPFAPITPHPDSQFNGFSNPASSYPATIPAMGAGSSVVHDNQQTDWKGSSQILANKLHKTDITNKE
jgi:hypothetical protein